MIPDLHFVAAQCGAQIIDDSQALQEFVLTPGCVDVYFFPVRHRIRACDRRVAQQICRGPAVTWEFGNSDLRLQRNVYTAQRHTGAENAADMIGVGESRLDVVSGQHQHKLIRSGMTKIVA